MRRQGEKLGCLIIVSEKNYYRILSVAPSASTAEIKRSYHRLAREYHPDSSDHHDAEQLFKELAEAYSVLSNPRKRLEYDLKHRIVQTSYEKIREYEKAAAYTETEATEARTEPPNRGSRTFRHQSGAEAVNLNSARFSVVEESSISKFLNKLFDWNAHKETLIDWLQNSKSENTRDYTSPPTGTEGFTGSLRGERQYQFTIDALQSLHGTSRELALQVNGQPKTIRVNIPAGVQNGATLRIDPSGKGEEIRIKVIVSSHQLIERDGNDIIVKLPVTLSEAVNGAEIEVPTLDGPVLVKLPPQSPNKKKKLRLKGRGCKASEHSAEGDLYVETYIVIPESDATEIKSAAALIEPHYPESVRKDLPKKL